MLKITLTTPRPRNPLVAPSRRRLAGAHRRSAGAARREAAVALRRELRTLEPSSP